MKLNAICTVKNEVDVIEETLKNALDFCHRIYIFDNHSTDGTWEIINRLSQENEKIVIAERSDEVYRNQFRNRVFNKYHSLYEDTDWWYILDADEMLVESPIPLLKSAEKKNKNAMDVWQAQFYFTDEDLNHYDSEDKTLPISYRRLYYRINWREERFFVNRKFEVWPENISGKVPPWANRKYAKAPVCRHYAERTPEQVRERNEIRMKNPYSFLHVKKNKGEFIIKSADELNIYYHDGQFIFSLNDQIKFYSSTFKFWVQWRLKNVVNLFDKLFKSSSARKSNQQ